MTQTQSTVDAAVAAAQERFDDARWDEAYELLRRQLDQRHDHLERIRLQLALVNGYSEEDWTRGLTNRDAKRVLLDEIEASLDDAPDSLRAAAQFARGMALHIEFVMDVGDLDRELQCFTNAAALYELAGDTEGAAFATAMIGIFHHVDRLDRDTAEPILRKAYEMAPDDRPSLARSEAARHLGHIQQERGDPAGSLPMLEESLRLREQAGARRLMASGLHALGFARFEAGDWSGAEDALRRAREIAESMGARFWLAMIACTEADMEMARLVGPGLWRRDHP